MTIPQAAFVFGTLERTDVDKTWSDTLLPTKTTSLINREAIEQNKIAALVESFPAPTVELRNVDKTWSDDILPTKTTITSDLYVPEWISAIHDETSCPGDPVTCDLTWNNHGYNSWTIYIQRYTSGVWQDVVTSLAAGTENYSDTGASEDTTKYRIKFNIADATWVEIDITILCPE